MADLSRQVAQIRDRHAKAVLDPLVPVAPQKSDRLPNVPNMLCHPVPGDAERVAVEVY